MRPSDQGLRNPAIEGQPTHRSFPFDVPCSPLSPQARSLHVTRTSPSLPDLPRLPTLPSEPSIPRELINPPGADRK